MAILHNGNEYSSTKIINYSAAPDYNRGVTVDNIQSGNYQVTDNGFLFIQLQSQQSNPTKVSVVRSKTPITDTGTEIASIVLSQYQYSETLTAQVMARDYYKLVIEGVGNPQVISCMFYPYASNVPMKLTENITVEQVEGLENELAGKQNAGDYATNTALNNGLATKQNAGNYFNKDTDVLDIAHGGHGGTTTDTARSNLEAMQYFAPLSSDVRCNLNNITNTCLIKGNGNIQNSLGGNTWGHWFTFYHRANNKYQIGIHWDGKISMRVCQGSISGSTAYGEWILLRNADGSIPVNIGGTGTTVGALPFSGTVKENITVSDDFTTDLNVGDFISILLKGSTKSTITQTYTQNGTYLIHWFRRRKDTKELIDNNSIITVVTPSNKASLWNGQTEGMVNIIRIK